MIEIDKRANIHFFSMDAIALEIIIYGVNKSSIHNCYRMLASGY